MKGNKTKCFHEIDFYASTLSQNTSTIENSQHLITRAPVRTNNSKTSTPHRGHIMEKKPLWKIILNVEVVSF